MAHVEVFLVGFPPRNYLVGSRVHRPQFLSASGILPERPDFTGVKALGPTFTVRVLHVEVHF